MKYEVVKHIKEVKCRPFNPKETLTILKLDLSRYWSWGVSKLINYQNEDKETEALVLKVSGALFKGYVSITLGADDLYIVQYINIRGRLIETQRELYFDMLADSIDRTIEKKQ